MSILRSKKKAHNKVSLPLAMAADVKRRKKRKKKTTVAIDITCRPRRWSGAGPDVLAPQQLSEQMSSAAADIVRQLESRRSGAGLEALAPQQLSEQMPPAGSAVAAAMQQAGVKTAAVSAVRAIHDLVLERPQSPQLQGGFNKCRGAARAQALDPYRERLVLLGVLLCACCQTAAVSAIRTIHDLVLERPQSPQLSGGFKCSDAARSSDKNMYREERHRHLGSRMGSHTRAVNQRREIRPHTVPM